MSNEINIDKLFGMAEEDVEKAVTYELESDVATWQKEYYRDLFYFYCEEEFCGRFDFYLEIAFVGVKMVIILVKEIGS